MELNKLHFEFGLTDSGWREIKPGELEAQINRNDAETADTIKTTATVETVEAAKTTEFANSVKTDDLSASGSLAILRVTEFSHDHKPDIWYKPEIVHLCESDADRVAARERFKKYGLPALLKQTCWADLDALRDAIKKGLDDESIF